VRGESGRKLRRHRLEIPPRFADQRRIEDDDVVGLADLIVILDLVVVDADVRLNGRARSLRRINPEGLGVLASRESTDGDQLRQRHAPLSPASVEPSSRSSTGIIRRHTHL
jgi:hypothetical protein